MSDNADIMCEEQVHHLIWAGSTAKLGEIFRAERKALGLTQAQVAERAGCRRQTIVDLESGKSVTTIILFAALSAIGKHMRLDTVRINIDNIRAFLGPEWDED